MDPIARKIARFAIDLKYSDLPDEVVYQTKRFLFDSIGCAYGAIKTKAGKEFSQYLEYPKGDSREPMTDEDAVFNFEKSKITNFMETLEIK